MIHNWEDGLLLSRNSSISPVQLRDDLHLSSGKGPLGRCRDRWDDNIKKSLIFLLCVASRPPLAVCTGDLFFPGIKLMTREDDHSPLLLVPRPRMTHVPSSLYMAWCLISRSKYRLGTSKYDSSGSRFA
jgi:hypothetical protein